MARRADLKRCAVGVLVLLLAQGCGDGASTADDDTSSSEGGGGTGGSGGTDGSGGAGGSGGSALPICEVLAQLDTATLPNTGAASDAYVTPSSARRASFRAALAALVSGDAAAAATSAAAADYQLCQGAGEEADLVLLRPSDDSGQAWVVYRRDPTRDLLLGTPHAFHETSTLEEARVIFEQLGARAVVATATHRCASAAASACDGSTAVCSTADQPFRVSDMAHVSDSLFQAAHEELLSHFPSDTIVSLHGMSRGGVSVSNGGNQSSPASSTVAKLTNALTATFPAELITTCNDYGAGNHEEHLCGTTNTQGRLVNGSVDACTTSASANGRFIHLEQGLAVRARPFDVADAIGAAIPQ